MQSQQNGLYLYMITLKALNSGRNARATITTTRTKNQLLVHFSAFIIKLNNEVFS